MPSLSNDLLEVGSVSWSLLSRILAVFVKCQSQTSVKSLGILLSVLWREIINWWFQAVMLLSKTRIGFFVTGNRVDMMLFHNYFKSRAVKSLLIVGAGKIAYYLLGILKDSRIDTKVIEINPERARFFSEKFPNLYIVQGDGTAKTFLLEEKCSPLWCSRNLDWGWWGKHHHLNVSWPCWRP